MPELYDGSAKHFSEERQVTQNGVTITITPSGFDVVVDPRCLIKHPTKTVYLSDQQLVAEIYMNGDLKKKVQFRGASGYRDKDKRLDSKCCGLWVKNMAGQTVAELNVEIDPFPFMKPQGDQQHITENYVSVPPALTITDETGAIWTLGMTAATKDKSPKGEFAFHALRNGENMGEICSRIERKNSRIRIFTKAGWKVWNGRSFF